MGCYGVLKARRDGRWEVEAGALDIKSFFKDEDRDDWKKLLNPKRYRIIWAPNGLAIGDVVRLTDDGKVV